MQRMGSQSLRALRVQSNIQLAMWITMRGLYAAGAIDSTAWRRFKAKRKLQPGVEVSRRHLSSNSHVNG